MTRSSRRQFLAHTVPLTLGATLGLGATVAPGKTGKTSPEKTMKILVVGAHPDDPETMCGGTMALYSAAGHEVVSVYLTRGEAGIPGKSHEEAARIRTAEALAACGVLKARPVYIGQTDGNCEITGQWYDEVLALLEKEAPDILFTHWPVDTHRDHRICSVLVFDAWLRMESKPALYYGEVMSGVQSRNFSPTDYVDISGVLEQKHRACYAHASQGIESSYAEYHGKMEAFRGMEYGCGFAEAFIRQLRSTAYQPV